MQHCSAASAPALSIGHRMPRVSFTPPVSWVTIQGVTKGVCSITIC